MHCEFPERIFQNLGCSLGAFRRLGRFFSYDKVSGDFRRAGHWPGHLLLPTLCRDATRGKENIETRGREGVDFDRVDLGVNSATFPRGNQCWYEIADFRRLYPEYEDLSDTDLSDRAYKRAGITTKPARPWASLGLSILIAFGIPALVLAIGWALSGFDGSRPERSA